jgi:hypothetical protein
MAHGGSSGKDDGDQKTQLHEIPIVEHGPVLALTMHAFLTLNSL